MKYLLFVSQRMPQNTGFLLFVILLFLQTFAKANELCDDGKGYRCDNSSLCISLSRVKDGRVDCKDASDEKCPAGQFECRTGLQCIDEIKRFDGWNDCLDGSDEECSSEEFKCRCGKPKCVDRKLVVDGVKDCEDGSDEGETGNNICAENNALDDDPMVAMERKKRQAVGAAETLPPRRRGVVRRVRPGTGYRDLRRPIFIRRNKPTGSPVTTPLEILTLSEIPTTEQSTDVPEVITEKTVPTIQPLVRNGTRRVVKLIRTNSRGKHPSRSRIVVTRRPEKRPNDDVLVTFDDDDDAAKVTHPISLHNTTSTEAHNDLSPSYSTKLPITYYTTYTYFTTVLNGPFTSYVSHESVVSNVATQTLDNNIVSVIQSNGGYSTSPPQDSLIHLGSRTEGTTTTVLNFASRLQIFNSDVIHGEYNSSSLPLNKNTVTLSPTQTVNIKELAMIPNTLFTLLTHFYTFYDGTSIRHSVNEETVSNLATDPSAFLEHSYTNTIDEKGYLTALPETQLLNLGSTDISGTITRVNLGLRTLAYFDKIRNVAVSTLSDIKPTSSISHVTSHTPYDNRLDPTEPFAEDQQLIAEIVPLEPSYFPAGHHGRGAFDFTPPAPGFSYPSERGNVRIVSSLVQKPVGRFRSRSFPARPGLRVRVRPATNRKETTQETAEPSLQPEQPYIYPSESHVLFHLNSYYPEQASVHVGQLPPNDYFFNPYASELESTLIYPSDIFEGYHHTLETDLIRPTATLSSNTFTETAERESEVKVATPILSETSAESPSSKSSSRKRLKITIRRPATSDATEVTHSSVLSDSPEASKPRFYVVTRSGAGGSTRHPANRLFKVTRRVRPGSRTKSDISPSDSQTVLTSDSIATATEEPVPSVQPGVSSAVLTYFTTTTFTVPVIVGDRTFYRSSETTNSRIVTETFVPSETITPIRPSSTSLPQEQTDSSYVAILQPSAATPPLLNDVLSVSPSDSTRLETGLDGVTTHIFSSGNNGDVVTSILYPGMGSSVAGTKVIRTNLHGTGFTSFYGIIPESAILSSSPKLDDEVITSAYSAQKPETLGGQISIGNKFNLVTRVSNGVTLIVASGADGVTTNTLLPEPSTTLTFKPTLLTDAVLMKDSPRTISYSTKTFHTTYTFFRTFMSGNQPIVTSSEEVRTNLFTIPITLSAPLVTASVSAPAVILQPQAAEVVTLYETKERVVTATRSKTSTFYATLFTGTSSFVTPVEEVHTELMPSTETFIITRTVTKSLPQTYSSIVSSSTSTTPITATSTFFTTFTKFLTQLIGTDIVTTTTKEIVSDVVTITYSNSIPPHSSESSISSTELPLFTTKTQYSTQTHFVTLFNGDQTTLSSIKDVSTTVITEQVSKPESRSQTSTVSSSLDKIVTVPSLVPSVQPYYTTYTFFTTLFNGATPIISSREEISTSYITLFVPPSLLSTPPLTSSFKTTIDTRSSEISISTSPLSSTTLTFFTTLFNGDDKTIISSETVMSHGIKSSTLSPVQDSVLTLFTTYTFSTTLMNGTDTVVKSTESAVSHTIGTQSDTTEDIHPSIITIISHGSSLAVQTTTSANSEIETETALPSRTAENKSEATPTSTILKVQTLTSTDSSVSVATETLLAGTSTTVNGSTVVFFSEIQSETTSAYPGDIMISSEIEATPSLPIDVTQNLTEARTSTVVLTEQSKFVGEDNQTTTLSPNATLLLVTGTDGAVTRLTESTLPAELPIVSPTNINNPLVISSDDSGKPPGTVFELSELLSGNSNIAANIGEAIKGIINQLAKNTTVPSQGSTISAEPKEKAPLPPAGGVTVSNAEEPTYIPIGALGRNTNGADTIKILRPSVNAPVFGIETNTLPGSDITVFQDTHTPLTLFNGLIVPHKKEKQEPKPIPIDSHPSGINIDHVIKAETIFIEPTRPSDEAVESPATNRDDKISPDSDSSVITNERTIFFDTVIHNIATDKIFKPISRDSSQSIIIPSVNHFPPTIITSPLQATSSVVIASSIRVSSTVASTSVRSSSSIGIEPSIPSPAQEVSSPPSEKPSERVVVNIQTIFFETKPSLSSFPIIQDSFTPILPVSIIATDSAQPKLSTSIQSSSDGATTIFFPLPGQKVPSIEELTTRYITSVESITRTLTLTTTSIFYTKESPLTISSKFTTTIPPRTFVSTIIGTKTILGTLTASTETAEAKGTSALPSSEFTTTVTTTTQVFNSIPTAVIKTLILPAKTAKPSISTVTNTVSIKPRPILLGNRTTNRPRYGLNLPTTTKSTGSTKRFKVPFKPPTRPTEFVTSRPTGPKAVLRFPTPRTTTPPPPTRPTTTTTPKPYTKKPGEKIDYCEPKCRLELKETCKNIGGKWTCICRPGFAKKKDSKICEESQQYMVLLRIVKIQNETANYKREFSNSLSKEYKNFAGIAKEALDEAYNTTDVRTNFIGSDVVSILDGSKPEGRSVPQDGLLVNFTVQMTRNAPADENLLKQQLERSLRLTNYSIGGSELYSSAAVEGVRDLDECSDDEYNDCSTSAVCTNKRGTYECRCKEGYQDLDEKYSGRICSGETKNCDFCGGRGDCIMTEDDIKICRCHRMYLGKQCEINGLVIAIALPIALALLILLAFCLLFCCRRLRKRRKQKANSGNMFRGIGGPLAGTLDRKAMIMDTSSESSGEHLAKQPKHHDNAAYDGFMDAEGGTAKRSGKKNDPNMDLSFSTNLSVPSVMIPRARHQRSQKQHNAAASDSGLQGRQSAPIDNSMMEDRLLHLLKGSASSRTLRNMKEQSSFASLPNRGRNKRRRPSEDTNNSSIRAHRLPGIADLSKRSALRDSMENYDRLGERPPSSRKAERQGSMVGTSSSQLSDRVRKYCKEYESRTRAAAAARQARLSEFRPSSVERSTSRSVVTGSGHPNRSSSEAGRSYDETTIQPPVKRYSVTSDYCHSSSKGRSSRNLATEDLNTTERDEAGTDVSFSTSAMGFPRLERIDQDSERRSDSSSFFSFVLPKVHYGGKQKSRTHHTPTRNQYRNYYCYEQNVSLDDERS